MAGAALCLLVVAAGVMWLGADAPEPVAENPPLGAYLDPHARPAYGMPLGDVQSDVVVLMFSDFACPACRVIEQAYLPGLVEKWVLDGRVQVVRLDFAAPHRPSGAAAARAARCAGERGEPEFWRFAGVLYATQRRWADMDETSALALFADLHAAAGGAGDAMLACLRSGRWAAEVEAGYNLARALGGRAAPLFVVAGRVVTPSSPLAVTSAIVDALKPKR